MTMAKLVFGVSLEKFLLIFFSDQGKYVILVTYTVEVGFARNFDPNFA